LFLGVLRDQEPRLRFFVDDGIVVAVKQEYPELAAAPRLTTIDDYFNAPETLLSDAGCPRA